MSQSRRDFLHSAILTGSLAAIHPGSRATAADASAKWPANPFLQGNYAPVHEEVTLDNLPVEGEIPAELDGMLVRNGPNPQFPPIGRYHWFDGDGMLHGVRLTAGKASYRNRFIRTAGYVEEKTAGKALYRGLTEPPDISKMIAGGEMFKNVANTSVLVHHRKLLAQWEGGAPHAIDPKSLDTIGRYTFDGKLKHAWTAHPKIDPETGEMVGFGYDTRKPFLQYSVVQPDGKLVRTVPVELPQPVMMHDFAITKNYAVFMDLPMIFELKRMLTNGSPWYFDRERVSRFGLVPRTGTGSTKVRWFTAPACFVFHVLNAWEIGDEVDLVACRYDRFPGGLGLGGNAAEDRTPNLPRLHHWRFNLTTGKTHEESLDEVASEFPRFNDAVMGRPTRFGYTGEGDDDFLSGFRKYDLERKVITRHRLRTGESCGEAIFVARPDGKSEDDGWLISYTHDKTSGKSSLIILDARDLSQKPLARVNLPVRVPYGFHGTWVPGSLMG